MIENHPIESRRPSPFERVWSVLMLMVCFGLIFVGGCASLYNEYVFEDVALVRVQPGQDARMLAAKYLGSPDEAWRIYEFNNLSSIPENAWVVVPLKPVFRGGLHPSGLQTVPILVYTYFSWRTVDAQTTPQDDFDAQMAYIKHAGFQTITLDGLTNFLDFKKDIPGKSVLITIDGGWRSAYDIALPILKKYGLKATFFIDPARIDTPSAMSWKHLRELRNIGMDIQAKGPQPRTNPKASTPTTYGPFLKELDADLNRVQETFQKQLGVPCRYLAYPDAEVNPVYAMALEKHGFLGAFTMDPGSNPFYVNPYYIHRIPISGKTSLEAFQKSLSYFQEANLK